MTKLQQLKAYQPPKLNYLAQIKYSVTDGVSAKGGAYQNVNRSNLISADDNNISHNPRLVNKQILDKSNNAFND